MQFLTQIKDAVSALLAVCFLNILRPGSLHQSPSPRLRDMELTSQHVTVRDTEHMAFAARRLVVLTEGVLGQDFERSIMGQISRKNLRTQMKSILHIGSLYLSLKPKFETMVSNFDFNER